MGSASRSPNDTSDDLASLLVRELRACSRILLLTHENPDGDGIGSVLALRLGLVALGKDVTCVAPEGCPRKYLFLPGAESLLSQTPAGPYDCAVALDCDGEGRMADLSASFRAAPLRLSIDHHQAECHFADLNWCDGRRPATGLMIWELLGALGVAITPQIATCLYTAVATDTGIFRFQNTTAEALRVGGELVALGADPSDIARRCADRMPAPKARLLGRALASLRLVKAGSVLVAVLTQEDFDAAEALPEHTDGVIDELKRIEGAQVIVLLREQAPETWRVSLRSLEADVAAICRGHGGGGHRLAAGCEMTGSLEAVVGQLGTEAASALEAPAST